MSLLLQKSRCKSCIRDGLRTGVGSTCGVEDFATWVIVIRDGVILISGPQSSGGSSTDMANTATSQVSENAADQILDQPLCTNMRRKWISTCCASVCVCVLAHFDVHMCVCVWCTMGGDPHLCPEPWSPRTGVPLASAGHWSHLEPKAGHMLDEKRLLVHRHGVLVVKNNGWHSKQRCQDWFKFVAQIPSF